MRVPNELAEAVTKAAQGIGTPEWLRQAIQRALGAPPLAVGSAQAAGFEAGKRQGWAHANKVFRDALGVAAKELKQ